MIASLSGKISQVEGTALVVEVGAGAGSVGLLVNVPRPFADGLRRGEVVFLYTQLIVREDLLALYGFDSLETKEFFSLLLTVDGIGPKLALAVLSTLSVDAIRRAVFNEQPEVFSRVPGIGKKTAQKILFNLKDRISTVEGLGPIAALTDADTEVLEALTTLGYSVVEAQAALQSIPRSAPSDVAERLRLALQYFGS